VGRIDGSPTGAVNLRPNPRSQIARVLAPGGGEETIGVLHLFADPVSLVHCCTVPAEGDKRRLYIPLSERTHKVDSKTRGGGGVRGNMVRGSHGHWVGYVITPGLAIGVATSLWSIIRGAWGVFVEGHAERRARPKAPSSQQ
jgi:hypothetical protein